MMEGEEEEITTTTSLEREKYDETSRMFSALAYVVTVFCIGLPMWWKTTEVYRFSIPYGEISQLAQSPIDVHTHVTVVTSLEYDRQQLERLLNERHSELLHSDILRERVSWDVRSIYVEEVKAAQKVKSLSELDIALYAGAASKGCGHFSLYLLDVRIGVLFKDVPMFVGSHCSAFVRHRTLDDISNDVTNLYHVVKSVFMSGTALERALSVISPPPMPDKSELGVMRTLPYAPIMDITFTLLIPEPLESPKVWSIGPSIKQYLEPFVKNFQGIFDIRFKSQVLYLTSLAMDTQFDPNYNHYILPANQLPHLINPLETRLGAPVSINPNLNFILYIPATRHSPLRIHTSQGQPSMYNAFLIPRWGGVQVYNSPERGDNFTFDMPQIMGIFLSQLRSLLGLPSVESSETLTVAPVNPVSSLRNWEIDVALQHRATENLLLSSRTLNSLAKLLDEIQNMVISDEVGQRIASAVQQLELGYHELKEGNSYRAFNLSKEAWVNAESAFFDRSMLALLYFPDDQKYAIYIPLFLPVSIPLLMSVLQIKNWLIRCRYGDDVKKPTAQ